MPMPDQTASRLVAAAATVAPAALVGGEHDGHAGPAAPPALSPDVAHEMGHGGGQDLSAMVRDMRNRFWICLIFTVPLFVYSPMGMFTPPAPPFGLDLNVWLFGFATLAIVYPSWPFFVAAWRAVRKGTLGMAALIVLSVGTGYLFSVGAPFVFKGGGLVFILLGVPARRGRLVSIRAESGGGSAVHVGQYARGGGQRADAQAHQAGRHRGDA